jgi:SAM-dependent methyltransferase
MTPSESAQTTHVDDSEARQKASRMRETAASLDRAVSDENYPMPPERGVVMGTPSFRDIGTTFLGYFVEFGDLDREHAVLDIGCGGGRMAAPLLYYLDGGSYRGFDVHQDSIDWCLQAIAPLHPRFDFEFVDLDNPIYNRSERSAADFVFPYDDDAFDFAIATSVFTHMFSEEVANYLRQTFRVLRPGGAFFCTAFLLTPSSTAEMTRNAGAVKFAAEHQGSLINDPDRPAGAVAHFAENFLALATMSGFIPERIIAGQWPGSGAGVTKQDIVVLRKVDRLASRPRL